MNCCKCKRPLATEQDHQSLPDDHNATHLCWREWEHDTECERIGGARIKSAMSILEIIEDATADRCSIEIETWDSGFNCEIEGLTYDGWSSPQPTVEQAIVEAWEHYQFNKRNHND